MEEVVKFERQVQHMTLPAEPVLAPVAVVRFTHHTISSDLAFGDEHENRRKPIFNLFDGSSMRQMNACLAISLIVFGYSQ